MSEINDNVEAMYRYLLNNLSDDVAEHWYYDHNPVITARLNGLSQTDCNRLTSEILNWNETALYQFADPASDVSNPYLDGLYLYGQIFLKIENKEHLEYLVENIQIIKNIEKGRQLIGFYRNIEKKIVLLNDKFIGSTWYNINITAIRSKIEDEENNSR